jgi:hypothetical protein
MKLVIYFLFRTLLVPPVVINGFLTSVHVRFVNVRITRKNKLIPWNVVFVEVIFLQNCAKKQGHFIEIFDKISGQK